MTLLVSTAMIALVQSYVPAPCRLIGSPCNCATHPRLHRAVLMNEGADKTGELPSKAALEQAAAVDQSAPQDPDRRAYSIKKSPEFYAELNRRQVENESN